MEVTPIVSVIMPVHNAAEYVEKAVDSILGQTFNDLELIVIDDGSTDGSGEILDRYQETDNRVRVVHQENAGVADSLNAGIRLAKGIYVARMDADDISLPDRLEKQVAFMDAHPEVGVCGTACKLIGDGSGVTRPRTSSEEIKSWLLFGPCMAHPTVMMRRDLVMEHGCYQLSQAEDYDLWVRLTPYCEMANLPEPLVLYRLQAEQATAKMKSEVSRWSKSVHAKALDLLGVQFSEEELDLHHSLHTGAFEKSRCYVERVERWLCKLLEVNRESGVRDQKALASVLFEIWCCLLAREVQLGPWMWAKFKASEVYREGRASHCAYSSPAFRFLRAYMSRLLDKAQAGRSLKRAARTLTVSFAKGGRK